MVGTNLDVQKKVGTHLDAKKNRSQEILMPKKGSDKILMPKKVETNVDARKDTAPEMRGQNQGWIQGYLAHEKQRPPRTLQ